MRPSTIYISMENFITQRPANRLDPLNDFLFLKIMGEKGDEVQLLGFLNAVLEGTSPQPLASVEILENRVLTAENIGDKAGILDVLARLPDGTAVNIEVQIRSHHNMDKRSLFYWSRTYSQGVKAGQDYAELPKVIAINIVDFDFPEAGSFHTIFRLREEQDREITLGDSLEIHFVNMVKWRRLRGKNIHNEPLHRWLTWLDRQSPAELVEEVRDMDKAIGKADERHEYLSSDADTQRLYEIREKAFLDWNSERNYALREGRKEGQQNKAMEIARNLKDGGISPDAIAQFTGLTPEEIAGL